MQFQMGESHYSAVPEPSFIRRKEKRTPSWEDSWKGAAGVPPLPLNNPLELQKDFGTYISLQIAAPRCGFPSSLRAQGNLQPHNVCPPPPQDGSSSLVRRTLLSLPLRSSPWSCSGLLWMRWLVCVGAGYEGVIQAVHAKKPGTFVNSCTQKKIPNCVANVM